MNINSPEYRSIVSSLLGRTVQFEDVPQVPIPSSPTVRTQQLPPLTSSKSQLPPLTSSKSQKPLVSSPIKSPSKKKPSKKGKYVVINTGYTSRLIDKFQAKERLVKKGKGKNNDFYVISNSEKHTTLFEKLVFIYDKLWGKGVYSTGDGEETELLIEQLQKLKLRLDGSVVFRVDNLKEGDDLVYKLEKLNYCHMTIQDDEYWDRYGDSDEESEDRDNPYEEDQTYNVKGNRFRYIAIDSESG